MKRTFTHFSILTALTLLPIIGYSQDNYQPATAITLQGDTLKGLIDYRDWDKNPKSITFKNSLGEVKIFTPLTIKSFSVSNDHYFSGFVNIETSPGKIEDLTESSTPVLAADTAFLQAVALGNKSLYRYSKNSREYFYTKSDSGFDLLIYKKYVINKDRRPAVRDNNFFINQLALYLSDCPNVQKALQTTTYRRNSLNSVFTKYYACNNDKTAIQLKKPTHNKLGILAGGSITTVRISGSPDVFANDKSKNFAGGLFWNITLPGNIGHWSVENELFYSSYKVSGGSSYSYSPEYYGGSESTIAQSYLKINNLLRYQYQFGSTFVFLNAGISNGYSIQETNNQTTYQRRYSTETTETKRFFDDTRKYEQGLLGGFGTEYKKISCELRYERGNGFLPYIDISSKTSKYFLLIGYTI